MLTKEEIKKILLDQKEYFDKFQEFIEREIDLSPYIDNDPIIVISGIRRCGKSTLLKIIKKKLNPKNYLYCDFSDERFNNLKLKDLQTIYEIFLESYTSGKKHFFFDEMQYIKGWEKFVNRLYEKEEAKIFITGSNSTLLSSEISTVLTGRNKVIELFPLSFKEYLNSKEIIDLQNLSTKEKIKLNKYFEEYFNLGGFPYVLKTKDSQILKEYYSNILYKDIIVRKKIRQVKELKEISLFLINNVSQIISYKQIILNSNIKSTSTIKNFIDYLSEGYLLFTLSKYDASIRKQLQNPKKIYFIDTGLLKQVNIGFSENNGRFLENLVFIELLRRKKEIYYFKEEKECDFVIKTNKKITQAIQVTYELNTKNEKREIEGLISALKAHNLKEGSIITKEQEEIKKIQDYTIKIVPIFKWLLE